MWFRQGKALAFSLFKPLLPFCNILFSSLGFFTHQMCFYQTALIITHSSVLFNSKLSIQSLPIHSAFQRFIIPSRPTFNQETNTFIFQTSLNLHITFSFLLISNYLLNTTLSVQKMLFYSNLCPLSLNTELFASSHLECSRSKNVCTIKINITKGFITYSETFSCAICS